MKTAIFIKSYPPDYVWLAYCLRSIHKFVTGFSEIVVALPVGHELPLTKERVVKVDEWKDARKIGAPSAGYYQQMAVKICAYLHTPADFIFYVDSDCVFTRPFDISEMFRDGKPKLLRRTWEQAGAGVTWKEPAEQALGFAVPFDTMACHPSIYRRDTLRGLRAHIEKQHGKSFERYVRQADRFIEFVTLGNYALKFQPELYAAIDAGEGDDYPRPISQAWSWGGMTPGKRAELEAITA